mmetsp:Transcript_12482/g.33387  ORF Transcript_12482/g.33387 Transcript_12482/m.33387 type:complete len:255 (-) Transcript_12482:33-797(-)
MPFFFPPFFSPSLPPPLPSSTFSFANTRAVVRRREKESSSLSLQTLPPSLAAPLPLLLPPSPSLPSCLCLSPPSPPLQFEAEAVVFLPSSCLFFSILLTPPSLSLSLSPSPPSPFHLLSCFLLPPFSLLPSFPPVLLSISRLISRRSRCSILVFISLNFFSTIFSASISTSFNSASSLPSCHLSATSPLLRIPSRSYLNCLLLLPAESAEAGLIFLGGRDEEGRRRESAHRMPAPSWLSHATCMRVAECGAKQW